MIRRALKIMNPKSFILPKTKRVLDFVIKTEQLAHHEEDLGMEVCDDWEDIADYCDCELSDLYIAGEIGKWYMVMVVREQYDIRGVEVIDLCKVPGSPKLDWLLLGSIIFSFKVDGFFGEMKGSTSWKRFKEVRSIFLKVLGLELRVLDIEERGTGDFYQVIIYRKGKKSSVDKILQEFYYE